MADVDDYRCFIGGLAWATTDRDLKDAFQKFGRIIEARVVMDKFSGRSRGFGFVTFEDEKAMEDAIDAMNGADLDGRSITVNKAQSPPSGGGGGGGGGGGRNGGGGRGGGGGECFKCNKPGHFARECPSGDGGGGRREDRYGGGGDRYGSRGSDRGGDRYGGGPDRGGDRYSGGSRGGDRYGRERSGPYERQGGGSRGGGGGYRS